MTEFTNTDWCTALCVSMQPPALIAIKRAGFDEQARIPRDSLATLSHHLDASRSRRLMFACVLNLVSSYLCSSVWLCDPKWVCANALALWTLTLWLILIMKALRWNLKVSVHQCFTYVYHFSARVCTQWLFGPRSIEPTISLMFLIICTTLINLLEQALIESCQQNNWSNWIQINQPLSGSETHKQLLFKVHG